MSSPEYEYYGFPKSWDVVVNGPNVKISCTDAVPWCLPTAAQMEEIIPLGDGRTAPRIAHADQSTVDAWLKKIGTMLIHEGVWYSNRRELNCFTCLARTNRLLQKRGRSFTSQTFLEDTACILFTVRMRKAELTICFMVRYGRFRCISSVTTTDCFLFLVSQASSPGPRLGSIPAVHAPSTLPQSSYSTLNFSHLVAIRGVVFRTAAANIAPAESRQRSLGS